MRYLFLILLALSSCISPPEKGSPQGKMVDRLLGFDQTKGDQFNKTFDAGTSKEEKGSFFTRKGFKTKDFNGQKNFKTGDFAQAGKMSRMGSANSRMGQQTNRWEKSSFSTKENRMGGQSARMGDKEFTGADSTFKTGDYQPAQKSISRDMRPQIFGSPNSAPTAYSEEEISRLINR
jgi:hypothetical protein